MTAFLIIWQSSAQNRMTSRISGYITVSNVLILDCQAAFLRQAGFWIDFFSAAVTHFAQSILGKIYKNDLKHWH